ncbi:MAG TPA: polysaccharide pyruvyl transferase CsaB [Clostridiales bacterium UBA8960]|nr:polysaccharide pyruvyl transferase CsaB [Clostridiales bacterium UBA8960]
MSRVVISGFYGFNNIGDEAILETLISKLRSLDSNVFITVLSNNPEETRVKYGVDAVKRHDVFKVMGAIRKTDLLLSGGGSLLQDDTSARSIHYYLAIIKMGLMMRKKVFLISNGIGPLNREHNKKQVAKVLNKVKFTTVRDFNSKKLLEEIGVDVSKIAVSADLVIDMEMQPLDSGSRILTKLGIDRTKRKCIGIAIRQKDFRNQNNRDALVRFVNHLSKDYTVLFIPFYFDDDAKIEMDIRHNVDGNVHFISERYDADEVMSVIQHLDILIGSRLHSLIFSLVAEVPFIGISYDPKIENFMEMIDMYPVCSMKQFDIEALKEAVVTLEADYEMNKRRIVEAKDVLKRHLRENDSMLHKVL